MENSEFRQNNITTNWILYAPYRSKRPLDHKKSNKTKKKQRKYEKKCPFCPGNEEMLPSIIYELKEKHVWLNRIVGNKYPILVPSDKSACFKHLSFSGMKSPGRQEVIVEHPVHNKNIALFLNKELEQLIATYKKRFNELLKEDFSQVVLLFRNHGESAGASRIHPHSQIVTLGFVPVNIKQREQSAKKFFKANKKSLYKTMLQDESKERTRVLFENKSFLAFIPYAAEVRCEILILPKRHDANFGNINKAEIKYLAQILQKTLKSFYQRLNDPDYNLIIYSASKSNIKAPYLSWYIQVKPKFSKPAGFEIGSGINVNSSLPEIDAKYLRNS